MIDAIMLLSCLCILFGVAAWAYRCEWLAVLWNYNKLLKDYEESTRKNREQREMLTASEREAWKAYKRAFLISIDTDKARIAAEEHVKQLRAELDETKARLEAAEREEADTEVYEEETGTTEEAGAVSPSGGTLGTVTRNEGAADVEPGTTSEGSAAAADNCDAGACCGVGRCSER